MLLDEARIDDGARIDGLVDQALRLVPGDLARDVGDIYEQVAWLKAQGLVDASVDPKTFIDLSFVQGHTNVPK